MLRKLEIFDKKMRFFLKKFFREAISFFRVPGAGRVKLIINSTVHGLYGEPIFVGIRLVDFEIYYQIWVFFFQFFEKPGLSLPFFAQIFF